MNIKLIDKTTLFSLFGGTTLNLVSNVAEP